MIKNVENEISSGMSNFGKLCFDLGVVSKKKLMEFSIKGPDPPSQPLNGKKTWSKNALNHLK